MIELARHIEILLLSNDCVIVPGFGGFMAHHVDARYDEDDGMFLPPLRTLGFNPQLTMNDSLLVQSYIEAYDISYPEALRRIEGEVAELQQQLDADGRYELNDLGVLCMNEEGHLEFEPCEAGILTPGLYGLSSFQMPRLAQAEEVHEQTDAEPVSQETEAEEIVDDHGITIKMSWLRNVAAVAAAVIAFFMIGKPVSNSDIQQSAFIHISNETTDDNSLKDNQVDESASMDLQADASAVTDSQADEPASTVEQDAVVTQRADSYYTLVMASQVSEKNANIFIANLSKKGFGEGQLLQTSIRRVVYGSYTTENEAYNALQSLRRQSSHFREAWVMKVGGE